MNRTEKVKILLDHSILFTLEQKEAWLSLLPQMNEDELGELYVILTDEVKELKKEGYSVIEDTRLESEILESSVDHGASIESLNTFAKELRREVETPELRKPTPEESQEGRAKAPVPPKEKLQVPRAPTRHTEPIPAGALKSLLEIRTVDDLKKIQPANLRQGELTAQIDLIRAKIVSIAQANKLLPFYTVSAFEESALYKTYLQIGAAMISNLDADRTKAFEAATEQLPDKLSMREFEAIADLRKKIEQL